MYQRLIHTSPRENIRGNDRLFKPDHGLLQLQVASLTFYHYCFSHYYSEMLFWGIHISSSSKPHFSQKTRALSSATFAWRKTLSMKSIMNLTFHHTCYSVPYLAVTSLRENPTYVKVRAVSYYFSYLNCFNLINLGEPLESNLELFATLTFLKLRWYVE